MRDILSELRLERDELALKISKLSRFINESEEYKDLHERSKHLLLGQQFHMSNYHGVLLLRIEELARKDSGSNGIGLL